MALKEEETEEVKLAHSFSALPNTRTAADDEIWNASCPYRDGQTLAKSRSRFAKTELELGSKKINVKKGNINLATQSHFDTGCFSAMAMSSSTNV